MPRIPYASIDEQPEAVRAIMGAAPINVVRMLANGSPAMFEGFVQYSGSFFTKSRLPADLREIAILRAGYLAGADYETWQHEAIARDVGLSDIQIGAVQDGGSHPDILSPAQQAVLDFADEVIVSVRATDRTLAEVRRHLENDQLIDLIMVTGLYMTVSRLLETTGVEREERPISAKFIDQALD